MKFCRQLYSYVKCIYELSKKKKNMWNVFITPLFQIITRFEDFIKKNIKYDRIFGKNE